MLTDTHCRKAKPAEKPFKLTDGGGLYLYVTPAGGKHWRYRYEFDGRENTLVIGPYPAIGLTEARSARDEAKASKRAGRDPNVAKKVTKSKVGESDAATFEFLAREWHGLNNPRWTAIHSADVIGSLERFVFPALGPIPVKDIEPSAVLEVLRKIEKRPAIETARRVRQRMSSVFVYAIASGRAVTDPAAIISKALAPAPVKRRQLAITDIDDARQVLRTVEDQQANVVTKYAHNLRQDCLDLISHKLSRTSEWRLALAGKYPGDDRNGRAALKLADFAAEATCLPDDIWADLEPHYNWASENFADTVSMTNRNVIFRKRTPELASYWHALASDIRTAFEVN
ncbi:MAG: phage integrase [Rhizobium sp.]|nr:phage integrase [Rhizobium sp.]